MADYLILDGCYAVVYDTVSGDGVITFISSSKADADKECAVNNYASRGPFHVVALRRADVIIIY